MVTHQLVKYPGIIDTSRMFFIDSAYSTEQYKGVEDAPLIGSCEALLHRERNSYMCLDVLGRYYACYGYNNDYYLYEGLNDLPQCIKHSGVGIPECDSYCGIELTDVVQVRYVTYIYRIIIFGDLLVTSRGFFKCTFTDRLQPFRSDLKPYIDLRRQNKYFGYVFLDTGYGLLEELPNGELNVVEVPYEYSSLG